MIRNALVSLTVLAAATSPAVRVPPGPPQVITPPAPVAQPVLAPPTEPMPDDIPSPSALELVVTVSGEVVDDPVVSLPVGSLAVITLTGSAVTTTGAATVALNRETKNLDVTQNGHHVAFSSPSIADGVFLFTVGINNTDPAGAPHIAQRWIVTGAGPRPPPDDPLAPVTPNGPVGKITSVTYVYEKSDTKVPAAVQSGIDRLNVEKKVLATLYEHDSKDGTGEVPDQYKAPLAAAKEAGLPALVAMSGDKVAKVIPAPTTVEQVMGVVP